MLTKHLPFPQDRKSRFSDRNIFIYEAKEDVDRMVAFGGTMDCLVKRSCLQGAVAVPPSKSHTMRALIFAMMAKGKSLIENPLISPDVRAMIEACKKFGAEVGEGKALWIEGTGGLFRKGEKVIDANNSGQVFRFMAALGALAKDRIILGGDESIQKRRPIAPLLKGLEQLGAKVKESPVAIEGPLKRGRVILDGSDSQPVSGLLIACSFGEGPFEIEVENAGEKPWIDMTLHWLAKFGLDVTHENYARYWVKGRGRIEGFHYRVPGDFSSAAFPLVAALITESEVELENLDINDCQGDKAIIDVLIQMGAQIEVSEKVGVKRSKLQGMRIDVNAMIDAVCILAVVGCFAEGKTELYNAKIARVKECDRLSAMAIELRKMGAEIEEREDGLIIYGGKLKGAVVESHRDHRVAMALIVAAMAAKGPSRICDCDCIAKSYPGFATVLQSIGADITMNGCV